jgi:cobalt transporter subunit CbtA
MFQRIVSVAAIAGLISGLLLTAIQQLEIAPLIRIAEVQEDKAIAASASVHDHSPAGLEQQAWSPNTPGERLLATAISNVILATGFALLLVSAMSRKGVTGWRAGLAWGAAGYAVFFVAPSLGLPPELPGAIAAPLRDRELWWVGTVILSATGLWFVVFSKKSAIRIIGMVLLVLPHAIGAPRPVSDADFFSPSLADEFLYATYAGNAALWLAIGGLSGLFYRAVK